MNIDDFFASITDHYKYIEYTMIKNFNISYIVLRFLDINYIYDMINRFRREEKSREFLKMSLAGVDLSKSSEYKKFISSTLPKEKINPEEMNTSKNVALEILKGGKK